MKKKYLVIGNPIEHSLSPKLHNYWFNKYNIDAYYEKKKLKETDIKDVIFQIRRGSISGINVTVPFKKFVIPFLDELSDVAMATQSVNTIYKNDFNKVVGDNTDVVGFKNSIIKDVVKLNKFLILGAGGVVPSIVYVLNEMNVGKIIVSNRTKKKAEEIKKNFPYIEVLDWGNIVDTDMIINATSLGLKKEDNINLDFSKIKKKILFYDLIYNPNKTNFLLKGKELGHKTMNGKEMFLNQAQNSFFTWTGKLPNISCEVSELLDHD